ncbi:hypothetical protein [Lysobacter sp. CA199]|uniref:hypothetical protein n=1 Tax=Lysobacter sp. CA199 TaxID=3455608 RepID=UPI003F8D0C77
MPPAPTEAPLPPPRLLRLSRKYGNAALFVFLVAGQCMFLPWWIETPLEYGLVRTARILGLPILLLVVVYVVRYRAWLGPDEFGRSAGSKAFSVVVSCGLLLWCATPYFLLANALMPHGTYTHFGTAKPVECTRRSCWARFDRDPNGQEVEVRISDELHARLRPGDVLRCKYAMGALGVAYRWLRTDEGDVCVVIAPTSAP